MSFHHSIFHMILSKTTSHPYHLYKNALVVCVDAYVVLYIYISLVFPIKMKQFGLSHTGHYHGKLWRKRDDDLTQCNEGRFFPEKLLRIKNIRLEKSILKYVLLYHS